MKGNFKMSYFLITDGYCPELCFPDFNRYGTANELCGEAGFQFEIQPEKYEGIFQKELKL